MTEKSLPIRIKEVENGFTTTVWDSRPSPAKETVHVFESYTDLLNHILKHFGFTGKAILESVGPAENGE